MIRQGRGKGVEHVGIEAKIPLGVAIKSVKLTKCWIFPFITPSEAAILKVNLMKLTRLQSSPKAVDTATIDIGLVFVPSPTNLVEIPEGQPPHPIGWLVSNKLPKKVIFPITSRWSIHRGYLKISITVGVQNVDLRRETKLRNLNI
jgi:hypothetical protein